MLTNKDALDPQLLYNHHKARVKAHILIMRRHKEGKVSIQWELLEARLQFELKLMRSVRNQPCKGCTSTRSSALHFLRLNSYYGKLTA